MTGRDRLAPPGGLLVVTDRRQARRPLVEVIQAAVAVGARWVLLRERDLPTAERAALAGALRAILAAIGGTLIVAGCDPLGGDAVHLPAVGPDPAPEPSLIGRSGHNLAELQESSAADYVTLSPVFASRSKPGYGPPLHPDGLARLVRRTPVPVLALGGVTSPGRVAACMAAGAAGVAVMGEIMRATDPAGMVRVLGAATASTAAGRAGISRWSG